MKKVLFATTALVASAGVASAASSLDISGYAEMGIIGGDAVNAGDTTFHSDFQIDFSGTGTTDNGLTFGFSAQLDDGGNTSVNGNTIWDSETVFISGDWGTLTLGETRGAYGSALTEIGIGWGINDDSTTHAGFNFNSGFDNLFGGDDQILKYDNTFGPIGVFASIEQLNNGNNVVGQDGLNWGLGFTYDTNLSGVDLGFGLGYTSTDATTPWGGDDLVGISVDANFANGFRAILNYSDGVQSHFFNQDTSYLGLGLGYTTGPLTVSINYGEYDHTAVSTAAAVENSGFGLAANYDLGGGATALFTYTDARVDSSTTSGGFGSAAGNESWSLGLGMSF